MLIYSDFLLECIRAPKKDAQKEYQIKNKAFDEHAKSQE